MNLLKYFLQKVRKHYFILICLLIICSSIISSIILVVNAVSRINQSQRIEKFQNDYLYLMYQKNQTKVNQFQLYHDGAVIAVDSDNEYKCLEAEIKWMQTVDTKEKSNSLTDMSFMLFDACKME
jgi:uncharacterized protein YsxB (DUF464 family)